MKRIHRWIIVHCDVIVCLWCSGSVQDGAVGPAAEEGGAGDQTEGGPDGPAGEGPAAQRAGQSSSGCPLTCGHTLPVAPKLHFLFVWSAAGKEHKVKQVVEGPVRGEHSPDGSVAGH